MSILRYPHLFEPIQLGNTIFRSRVFASPTGGVAPICSENNPTAETAAYYERKAMGGAASVTMGECTVDSLYGMGSPDSPLMDNHNGAGQMYQVAHSISRYGAVASVELQHAGMYSYESVRLHGSPLYGPVGGHLKAGDVVAASEDGFIEVTEMPEEVILRTIEKFGDAAAYAKQCGFGMVMIHGGHGWLISQFLSPTGNTRSDCWGGSLENRMRLPLAIVDNIRKKCGRGFPIEFRMSGSECTQHGYDIDEGVRIAECLDGKVDLIHVSAGIHEDHDAFVITHPSMFHEQGCNVKYAAEIKKHVKTPVATVGGLSEPAMMEEIIASGKADVVEMARQIICDPDWPNKVRSGHEDDVRKCMRCFACFSNLITCKQLLCAINPATGQELDNKYEVPASKKEKVLVVGGGVAGMQAAISAKERGHDVILCEKSGRLGGTLRCEEHVEFKHNLDAYLNQQARKCAEMGIDIRLNTTVTPDYARSLAPDAIIAALGARPVFPSFIKGADGKNVVGAEEVYYDPSKAGQKVVILGGGLVGIELGLHLAGMGRQVSIVEMLPEIGHGGNVLHAIALDVKMRDLKIDLNLSTKALEITEKGLLAESKDGEQKFFEADTVIYAVGQRPLTAEASALYDCAPEFYILGDCRAPKNITAATQDAYYAARNIGRIMG